MQLSGEVISVRSQTQTMDGQEGDQDGDQQQVPAFEPLHEEASPWDETNGLFLFPCTSAS